MSCAEAAFINIADSVYFLYVYRGDSLTLSRILISLRGFLCLEFVTSTRRRYHVFPLGGFRVGIILTHLAQFQLAPSSSVFAMREVI